MGFSLSFPGLPIAQGRPRCACRGRIPRVYDPARSRAWKKTVATLLGIAAKRQGWKRAKGPLSVFLHFQFKHKSVGVRTARPDCDNLAKLVLDAANDVLWADDSQVVYLSVRKSNGPKSTTSIQVEEYVDDEPTLA